MLSQIRIKRNIRIPGTSRENKDSTKQQLMRTISKKTALVIFTVVLGFIAARSQSGPSAVRLVRGDHFAQLTIDNRPFLILGGELGNSSASSMDYMRPYW